MLGNKRIRANTIVNDKIPQLHNKTTSFEFKKVSTPTQFPIKKELTPKPITNNVYKIDYKSFIYNPVKGY
jgi:hypothetical protein